MPLDAGRLRHRVTLETPPRPEARDAYGAPVEAHAQTAETWAEVRTLSARELMVAQGLGAEASVVVTIRWRPDADRLMRVMFGGRVLNIVGVVDPDGRREQLDLTCTEPRG